MSADGRTVAVVGGGSAGFTAARVAAERGARVVPAENAVTDGDRSWTRRARIAVVFSDPEFAVAGMTPARAEADE